MMSYPLIICAVALLQVLTAAGVEDRDKQEDVYLLGHYFDQYEFSCAAGQLVTFSEDKHSLLFFDIEERKFVEKMNLSLPGQLLKWSPDGSRLVITHTLTLPYSSSDR